MPRLSDLVKADRFLFATEDGEVVLADLRSRFHISTPTFVAGAPHESAFLEGQRSVVLTIERMIKPDRKLNEGDDEDG